MPPNSSFVVPHYFFASLPMTPPLSPSFTPPPSLPTPPSPTFLKELTPPAYCSNPVIVIVIDVTVFKVTAGVIGLCRHAGVKKCPVCPQDNAMLLSLLCSGFPVTPECTRSLVLAAWFYEFFGLSMEDRALPLTDYMQHDIDYCDDIGHYDIDQYMVMEVMVMMMRCRISHRDCYIHFVISVTIGDGACSTSPRPPWGRSSVPAVANLQGPLWLMFVARCGRSLGPAVADFLCPSWPPVADLHGPPWLIYETHRGRSSGITMVDLWGPQWPIIETPSPCDAVWMWRCHAVLPLDILWASVLMEAWHCSLSQKCHGCQSHGATVGCCMRGCSSNFHFMCARRAGCTFTESMAVFLRPARQRLLSSGWWLTSVSGRHLSISGTAAVCWVTFVH